MVWSSSKCPACCFVNIVREMLAPSDFLRRQSCSPAPDEIRHIDAHVGPTQHAFMMGCLIVQGLLHGYLQKNISDLCSILCFAIAPPVGL